VAEPARDGVQLRDAQRVAPGEGRMRAALDDESDHVDALRARRTKDQGTYGRQPVSYAW